jgi:alkanesulfonate monooxygenase SsuD/methylene tetrahydromethanopterin reductase-like flavin-dependent oxidoreductase (luciferase family)
VRIFHFSEGAYHHIPDEDHYESVRVTIPNKFYDPRTGADLYHRYLDEWLIADDEGLDIMVNEHHQSPTCVDPAAPILLGILARQTKKARLLILGNPIANRNQPVRVAEEMAMVDVISRGRLECGFVKSVPYEVAPANSNPVRMTERMYEALDLIKAAWTHHDGPFSFEGRFFHHRCVNIWPRPYQQPHPPIWISSTSPEGAARVGEGGYTIGTFHTGFEGTKRVFDSYRAGWAKAGRKGPVPEDRLGYSALVYVGDTDEEGRAGAQKLLWYLSHNKLPVHFKNPPGYNSLDTNVKALRTGKVGTREAGFVPDLDHEIATGTVFCGNPDTVYRQIKGFYDHVGGFGHLLSMGQAGFLDYDESVKSIRLLGREVNPRLRELKLTAQAAE